ncbi:MAG TPA: glycerophosphodiester phosphodiesterase [Candidatus Saccharimonadales bacterium]
MLVMGHRGAAGLKPENTIAALRAGIEAGADIIEFDIRLTKDKVPVLNHDFHLVRTHGSMSLINMLTLEELQKRTAGSDHPIVTLDAALKECAGKVFLNIEFKQSRSFQATLPVLQKYITKKSDWKNYLFSAFSPAELLRIRKLVPEAQLSLLHRYNPFLFVRHMRKLKLAAVGFHRLNINDFALNVAKRLGMFTYAYTVNRPEAAVRLAQRGLDGIITDRPDVMSKALAKLK